MIRILSEIYWQWFGLGYWGPAFLWRRPEASVGDMRKDDDRMTIAQANAELSNIDFRIGIREREIHELKARKAWLSQRLQALRAEWENAWWERFLSYCRNGK